MNWVPILTILICFPFLAVLVCWLVLYIQFSYSAEKRWAAGVFDLVRKAEQAVLVERTQLRNLSTERDAKVSLLREKAYNEHLCDYSVNALEEYPGIGPATVAKLRAEGFVNLATLQRARIRVHGLGEKRLADIHHAIRNLLGRARSTFDAKGCRQAKELAEHLEELSTRYDRLEERSRTRKQAAEEFISRLGGTVENARSVTFWRWFRPISNVPLIPTELLDASLPDLGRTLREAEERMAQEETAKRERTTGKPDPVSAVSRSGQTVTRGQTSKHGSEIASNSEAAMQEESQRVLMQLTIQFAFGVARKDGPVNRTERELIRQFIQKRFGENRALMNRAEASCSHFERAAIDLEKCLREINQHFPVERRASLMEFAGQIIAASGNGTDSEAPLLHHLAESLAAPPLTLAQRVHSDLSAVPPERPASVEVAVAWKPNPSVTVESPVTIPRDECLRLLEIPAAAPVSADLVRRQWNLLSERLAPEKFAAMGPEFIDLAQTKLATLRHAAESLLEAMGEQLEAKPHEQPVEDLRHNPDLDDAFGGM